MYKLVIALLFMFTLAACDDTSLEPPSGSTGVIVGYVTLYDEFGQEQTDHSGAQVKITDPEITATTNADGRYELTGVPAGIYRIHYSKNGYGSSSGSEFQFVGADTFHFNVPPGRQMYANAGSRQITLGEPKLESTFDTVAFYVMSDSVVSEVTTIFRDGQWITLQPGDSIHAGLVYIDDPNWWAQIKLSVEPNGKPAYSRVTVSRQSGANISDPSTYARVFHTVTVSDVADFVLYSTHFSEMGIKKGERVYLVAWTTNSLGAANGTASNEVSFVIPD